MSYETLIYEEEGALGILTLNRPDQVNAMNRKMIDELELLLYRLGENRSCRVLILTGAGERGFCAGLDMKEAMSSLITSSAEEVYRLQSRTSRLIYSMRLIPQPVISAVHGAANVEKQDKTDQQNHRCGEP